MAPSFECKAYIPTNCPNDTFRCPGGFFLLCSTNLFGNGCYAFRNFWENGPTSHRGLLIYFLDLTMSAEGRDFRIFGLPAYIQAAFLPKNTKISTHMSICIHEEPIRSTSPRPRGILREHTKGCAQKAPLRGRL